MFLATLCLLSQLSTPKNKKDWSLTIPFPYSFNVLWFFWPQANSKRFETQNCILLISLINVALIDFHSVMVSFSLCLFVLFLRGYINFKQNLPNQFYRVYHLSFSFQVKGNFHSSLKDLDLIAGNF